MTSYLDNLFMISKYGKSCQEKENSTSFNSYLSAAQSTSQKGTVSLSSKLAGTSTAIWHECDCATLVLRIANRGHTRDSYKTSEFMMEI